MKEVSLFFLSVAVCTSMLSAPFYETLNKLGSSSGGIGISSIKNPSEPLIKEPLSPAKKQDESSSFSHAIISWPKLLTWHFEEKKAENSTRIEQNVKDEKKQIVIKYLQTAILQQRNQPLLLEYPLPDGAIRCFDGNLVLKNQHEKEMYRDICKGSETIKTCLQNAHQLSDIDDVLFGEEDFNMINKDCFTFIKSASLKWLIDYRAFKNEQKISQKYDGYRELIATYADWPVEKLVEVLKVAEFLQMPLATITMLIDDILLHICKFFDCAETYCSNDSLSSKNLPKNIEIMLGQAVLNEVKTWPKWYQVPNVGKSYESCPARSLLTGDGKHILLKKYNTSYVEIWDVEKMLQGESNVCINTLFLPLNIASMTTVCGSDTILFGCSDGMISILNASSGKEVRWLAHREVIRKIWTTFDGQYIISSAYNESKIWRKNSSSYDCIKTMNSKDFPIIEMAPMHRKNCMVGLFDDKTVRSIDMESILHENWQTSKPIGSCVSFDKCQLIVTPDDKNILFSDLENLFVLNIENSTITKSKVSFMHDGNRIYVHKLIAKPDSNHCLIRFCSHDAPYVLVKEWNILKGMEVEAHTLDLEGPTKIMPIGFTRDGYSIYFRDNYHLSSIFIKDKESQIEKILKVWEQTKSLQQLLCAIAEYGCSFS